MDRDALNTFCASLPATTHVVQWGNADVWKLGGKVFAICGWNDGKDAFTFKVTPMAYEILSSAQGIRPAPYLASRGMKWVQVTGFETLSPQDVRDHIKTSYDLIAEKLTNKKRAELGI